MELQEVQRDCHEDLLKDWRKWWVELQEVNRKYHEEMLSFLIHYTHSQEQLHSATPS